MKNPLKSRRKPVAFKIGKDGRYQVGDYATLVSFRRDVRNLARKGVQMQIWYDDGSTKDVREAKKVQR